MIFSNTTPFISLCAINRINILPALFGRVHVVDAVVRECAAGGAILVPALDALDWITIVPSTTGIDPEPMLMQLDEGEKWTLHAARAAHAERLLIDEHIGRIVAERMGIRVTGTLGVLLKAKQQKLIPSFLEAARSMRDHGIYFHASLVERLARSINE